MKPERLNEIRERVKTWQATPQDAWDLQAELDAELAGHAITRNNFLDAMTRLRSAEAAFVKFREAAREFAHAANGGRPRSQKSLRFPPKTLDDLEAALLKRGYTRVDVGRDIKKWSACLMRGDLDACTWGPPRSTLREAVGAALAANDGESTNVTERSDE